MLQVQYCLGHSPGINTHVEYIIDLYYVFIDEWMLNKMLVTFRAMTLRCMFRRGIVSILCLRLNQQDLSCPCSQSAP